MAVALWLGILVRPAFTYWWLPCVLVAVVQANFGLRSLTTAIAALLPVGLAWLFPSGFWHDSWLVGGGEARQSVRSALAGVSSQARALVLGITDGDVALFSKSQLAELKQMSLTHLTAVSGTNCTILVTAMAVVLGSVGLPRTLRVTGSVCALLAYLVLVGPQSSVLRAAVMALVALAGLAGGQRFRAGNLLVFAVIVLLVMDPALATNLGLALSVSATAGVLWLAPVLQKTLGKILPRWLALAVSVASAAQLACLPLLVGLQPSFNAGGLLANLLAEPLVAPITILGLLGAVFTLLDSGWWVSIAQLCFWVASLFAQCILAISHFLSVTAPSVVLPGGNLGVFIAISLVAVAFALGSRQITIQVLAVVSATLLALIFLPQFARLLPTGGFPVANWVMVACDVGQGDATVLRAGGSFAVIDVGRDPAPVDRCLNRLGVRRIDILVLTHFDMDHVGGLAGALDGRSVGKALLTQFPDSRPGAQSAQQLLESKRIPVTKVALGDTGWLGLANAPSSLAYLVLTPHANGADSIDSNDGSVSMFWRGRGVNIFTMADLPASGQQRLMAERTMWWQPGYAASPTILKVSHHGSADQDPDFLAWVHADIATISVGVGNPYGHPTDKTLGWLRTDARLTLRTDQRGSISIGRATSGLVWSASGGG